MDPNNNLPNSNPPASQPPSDGTTPLPADPLAAPASPSLGGPASSTQPDWSAPVEPDPAAAVVPAVEPSAAPSFDQPASVSLDTPIDPPSLTSTDNVQAPPTDPPSSFSGISTVPQAPDLSPITATGSASPDGSLGGSVAPFGVTQADSTSGAFDANTIGMSATPAQLPSQPPSFSGDNGPTDLSHLVDTSDNSGVPESPVAQPVMTAESALPVGDAAQIAGVAKTGMFPKWIFLVGGVILLGVIGASAYFILGIGKIDQSTSLPAVQTPTAPTTTVVPSVSAIPSPGALAPGAGFGNLSGSTPSANPSVGTSSGQTGSSALDLLRQRQAKP